MMGQKPDRSGMSLVGVKCRQVGSIERALSKGKGVEVDVGLKGSLDWKVMSVSPGGGAVTVGVLMSTDWVGGGSPGALKP